MINIDKFKLLGNDFATGWDVFDKCVHHSRKEKKRLKNIVKKQSRCRLKCELKEEIKGCDVNC